MSQVPIQEKPRSEKIKKLKAMVACFVAIASISCGSGNKSEVTPTRQPTPLVVKAPTPNSIPIKQPTAISFTESEILSAQNYYGTKSLFTDIPVFLSPEGEAVFLETEEVTNRESVINSNLYELNSASPFKRTDIKINETNIAVFEIGKPVAKYNYPEIIKEAFSDTLNLFNDINKELGIAHKQTIPIGNYDITLNNSMVITFQNRLYWGLAGNNDKTNLDFATNLNNYKNPTPPFSMEVIQNGKKVLIEIGGYSVDWDGSHRIGINLRKLPVSFNQFLRQGFKITEEQTLKGVLLNEITTSFLDDLYKNFPTVYQRYVDYISIKFNFPPLGNKNYEDLISKRVREKIAREPSMDPIKAREIEIKRTIKEALTTWLENKQLHQYSNLNNGKK